MQPGFDASRSPQRVPETVARQDAGMAPAREAATAAAVAATDGEARAAVAVPTPLPVVRATSTQSALDAVTPPLSDRPVREQATAKGLAGSPDPLTGPRPESGPGPSTAAAAAEAVIVRPMPLHVHSLYSVHVGGELHYPRARGIDGPGPLALREVNEASTGLLAMNVGEHLVLMMSGPGRAVGPGPVHLPQLTGMIMVDPEDDDYLQHAVRAYGEFRSRAGEPVTVHVAIDVESFSGMVESQLDQLPLGSLLERYRIADRPPSDLDEQQRQVWALERIEAAHMAAAEGLAHRLGGQAINLPQTAVFLDPSGEVDTFEDEPEIASTGTTLAIASSAQRLRPAASGGGTDRVATASFSSLALIEAARSPSPDGDSLNDNASTESDITQIDPATPDPAGSLSEAGRSDTSSKRPAPPAGAPPK